MDFLESPESHGADMEPARGWRPKKKNSAGTHFSFRRRHELGHFLESHGACGAWRLETIPPGFCQFATACNPVEARWKVENIFSNYVSIFFD